ncbi:hypothetical protein OPQ81_005585 [Rhizoctonia solani]|nr:hypothetical protein OPQ81_005585 [Rhizoctonia solani]
MITHTMWRKKPNQGPNVDAARFNTFYTVNAMHDLPTSYFTSYQTLIRTEILSYKYGFTEAVYGGNNCVEVSVQDAWRKNNVNFATPPNGISGQMRMFPWDFTTPNRDGASGKYIIVHEFTHAGGMGEGWSDPMMDITEAKAKPAPEFALGKYVTNNLGGIRTHPYSTNMNTYPLTYAILKDRNEGGAWFMFLNNFLTWKT